MFGEGYKHFVKGIDPVADAFAGTVYSDVYSMRGHDLITFIIYKGVGITGTSTITIEACDDVVPSNVSAIPFRYQAITTGDTHGAETAAAATGFMTTAGSSQIYVITVKASALAASGYGFIRLKAVEVANDPVLGGVLAFLDKPKFDVDVQPSVLA